MATAGLPDRPQRRLRGGRGASDMPVPKREPVWVRAFLAALGSCGNVTRAAALAGVDTTGPYNRRNRYPAFRDEWERVVAAREVRAGGLASAEEPPPPAALVPLPAEAGREELVVSGAGARRGAGSRWSKAAEEVFLTELTINANVQRAAKAAGFSGATVYNRKNKDRHFAAGWDAAIAVGRARLESYLIVQAERNFDPEALPIGEGEPKVTVGEALGILKLKPGVAAGAGPAWDEGQAPNPELVDAASERILMRLGRMRQAEEAQKTAEGWTRHGEHWIPPGWGPTVGAGDGGAEAGET